MKKEKFSIKPIPQYIVKLIKKQDKIENKISTGQTRFYAYLSKMKGMLIKVTVALKYKNKTYYLKQVAVHGIDSKICMVKDINYYCLGGYVVGWHKEGLTKYPKWFESDEWGWADDKYFDPASTVVNKEYALKFTEYKYSAVDKYNYSNIFKYLRLYKKYPVAEYLIKLGLTCCATSITILKQLTKDIDFRRWVINNTDEIKNNYFYKTTLYVAYKRNKPIIEVQKFEEEKHKFCANSDYKELREYITKNELQFFFKYIEKQNTSYSSYLDYYKACKLLNLDLSLDKNKYPHNFNYWHDIRINEYLSEKAKLDKIEQQKFFKKFTTISKKYLSLQRKMKENFIVLIPNNPNDLVYEGKCLNHCVGSMGYDQKFIKEESLIFFVRKQNQVKIPFVTIEFSLQTKKILQIHGENNNIPNQNVLNYINKIWHPYVKKQLKKLVA